jgi:hypothetical protein
LRCSTWLEYEGGNDVPLRKFEVFLASCGCHRRRRCRDGCLRGDPTNPVGPRLRAAANTSFDGTGFGIRADTELDASRNAADDTDHRRRAIRRLDVTQLDPRRR